MEEAKKYAVLIVFVIAVLLAFSSPAAADYSGDHPLIIYDHDTINGSLVYDTVTDGSKYKCLYPTLLPPPFLPDTRPVLYQDLTVSIPGGATVKMARLYNTYCWGCWEDNDTIGIPANAKLTLTDTSTDKTWERTCTHEYTPENRDECPNPIVYSDAVFGDVTHYWDTKNVSKYGGVWDFPSGEFAWDVTGLVTHSGTYNASICDPRDRERVADERFCTFGFVLLVIYEDPSSPEIEYWIAEGCDALMARTFETPENATTRATFGGVSGATDANLTTVLTCSDGGNRDPPENMIYFNGEKIGPSTADGICHYGVNHFDVTSLLSSTQNVVEFQDRNDCEYVHNAFLVVEYEEGMCGDVDCSGSIKTSDAQKVWKRAVDSGFYLDASWAADVDCSGSIKTSDAQKVWKRAVDSGFELNCCCD